MKTVLRSVAIAIVVISVAMLWQCQACQAAKDGMGVIGRFLPWLGLAYGLFLTFVGHMKDKTGSEKWQQLYFGATSVVSLGAVLIIGAKFFANLPRCPLCACFWAAQAILFLELINSNFRIRYAVLSAILVCLGVGIYANSDTATRNGLRYDLSLIGITNVPIETGLLEGTHAPRLPEAGDTYQVIFWTQCPICIQKQVEKIIDRMDKNRPIFVVSTTLDEEIKNYLPHSKVILQSDKDYQQWMASTIGAPFGFEVTKGIVTKNYRLEN